jgi:tetratricopeptide (TPR) repeat protein
MNRSSFAASDGRDDLRLDASFPPKNGGGAAPDLSQSVPSSPTIAGAAAAGVTFGDNHVREFDPAASLDEKGRESPLVDPDLGDADLQPIDPVVVPQGAQLSKMLLFVIWIAKFGTNAINGFVNQTTSLDANQIAQAIRNLVRFRSKNNGYHIEQFLRRTLKTFRRLSATFDAKHPAILVTLLSLGYDEAQATKILEFFDGRSLKGFDGRATPTPRDRMCWFWIFLNLSMRTDMFTNFQGSWQLFCQHATNPSAQLLQQFQSVAQEAYKLFQQQIPVPTGESRKQGQGQARGDSAAASVSGSDFTAMTQVCGFLGKYHTTFSALSKLLNEWLSGNRLLREGKSQLSEEALITLVYRLLAKMQCSKTGKFGTDRTYSSHIYSTLMAAYWRAQKSGTRFVLRPQETFSSILCATGNYDAAIEWLNRALKCQHPKKGDLTPEEVAVLNFAFISMSLGVQSLASCTSENLEALFAHIFDGAKLEVDKSEAPKFQSAIENVAEDFANEPEFEAKPVLTEAVSAVSAVSEAPNGPPRGRGGPPRGRGGAVAGGGQTHRASQDARSAEFEEMMKAVAADPEKREALRKWLSESNK